MYVCVYRGGGGWGARHGWDGVVSVQGLRNMLTCLFA